MSTTTPKRSKTKARPAKPRPVTVRRRRSTQTSKPAAEHGTQANGSDASTTTVESGDITLTGGTSTKPLSGLDAAVQVLREAGEPLATQDLVKRMLDQGLWTTTGKTPASTIYAAIIREIKAKGSDARFQKVDRGRFAAVH